MLSISSILGITCAYLLTIQNSASEKIVSKKLGFTQPKRMIASKTNAMMDIQIESLNGIPEKDEQEIVLRATLTLKRPIDTDLNYKWMLPEGVQVVAGHLEDGWNQILPGQSVQTELTVTGLSKENPGKAVILHVESTSQGAKIGYSGVYAIDPDSVLVSDENTLSAKSAKVTKSKEEINAERLKGVSF